MHAWYNGKMPAPIVARDTDHLKTLVHACIDEHGDACDLNHIDVSQITDMSDLFNDSPFNGNISRWDTSSVADMSRMFMRSGFTGDISKWDVSNVLDMRHMFDESDFNGNISNWNVSKVQSTSGMFSNSHFCGDLSRWDVTSVQDMTGMFAYNMSTTDKPQGWNISQWDVSNVWNMSRMFQCASVHDDISGWCVGQAKSVRSMFEGAYYGCDVSNWQLHPDTIMGNMFAQSTCLANQTPCAWNIAFFLEESVLPTHPVWTDVFSTVAPLAQSLGLTTSEHAKLILSEYAQRHVCAAQLWSIALPDGTVEVAP